MHMWQLQMSTLLSVLLLAWSCSAETTSKSAGSIAADCEAVRAFLVGSFYCRARQWCSGICSRAIPPVTWSCAGAHFWSAIRKSVRCGSIPQWYSLLLDPWKAEEWTVHVPRKAARCDQREFFHLDTAVQQYGAQLPSCWPGPACSGYEGSLLVADALSHFSARALRQCPFRVGMLRAHHLRWAPLGLVVNTVSLLRPIYQSHLHSQRILRLLLLQVEVSLRGFFRYLVLPLEVVCQLDFVVVEKAY